MADRSSIEWTDSSWNPLRWCSRVSRGCERCYAEKVAARFSGPGLPYEGLIHPRTKGWNGTVRLVEAALMEPLTWRKPRLVFVNSMSDLFHESVPESFIDRVFAIMALAHQHTFQILTKRPARMLAYLGRRTAEIENDLFTSTMATALFEASRFAGHRLPGNAVLELLNNDDSWSAHPDYVRRTSGWPLRHVWLGVSVEDQSTADERIPLLIEAPAAVRWLSCEPLLGPIDLRSTPRCPGSRLMNGAPLTDLGGCLPRWQESPSVAKLRDGIDWVVAGGESGPGARPMHPAWARSLRDQCAAARVPFFFKQWGNWAEHVPSAGGDLGGDMRRGRVRIIKPVGENDGHFARGDALMANVGKKKAGRILDGLMHEAFPSHLEFRSPTAAASES